MNNRAARKRAAALKASLEPSAVPQPQPQPAPKKADSYSGCLRALEAEHEILTALLARSDISVDTRWSAKLRRKVVAGEISERRRKLKTCPV